jgi:hypothetical protein
VSAQAKVLSEVFSRVLTGILIRSYVEVRDPMRPLTSERARILPELIRKSLPQASMRILKAVRRSPLGLNLYKWLFYKTFPLYGQKSRPSFFMEPALPAFWVQS